jgi:CspA family cold shock protein
VHLVADEPEPGGQPARPLPAPSRPAPAAAAPPVPAAPAPPPAAPAAGPAARELSAPDEEQMCDVLSPPEFSRELTELLLNIAPDLTGQQILQTRQALLEFGKKHGWVDG